MSPLPAPREAGAGTALMGTSRPERPGAESSEGRPRGARRRGGALVQAETCRLGGRGPTPPAQDAPGAAPRARRPLQGGTQTSPGGAPPSARGPHSAPAFGASPAPRRDCSRIWGVRVISQRGGTRALSNKGTVPETPEGPWRWGPGGSRLARRRGAAAGGSEFLGVRVPRAPTLRPPPLEARPLVPARVAEGGSPGAQPGPRGGSQQSLPPCWGGGRAGSRGTGGRRGPRERGAGPERRPEKWEGTGWGVVSEEEPGGPVLFLASPPRARGVRGGQRAGRGASRVPPAARPPGFAARPETPGPRPPAPGGSGLLRWGAGLPRGCGEVRRATPARLGLSCRRAGSPSGRPRSAAPSGSADSRPRGLRRSGGLAPHRAAPRVPAEAWRPGPRDGRGTQPRAPWTSGRPSLAGAASSPPRRQDGRRRVGAAGLRRAPRGHQLAQPEPGRPAPAHGQRGRHGPALERRGRPVLRPAARARKLRDLLPAGERGRLHLQRRPHHQEVGRADRAVPAGVPRTHVHREQDPGRQQPAVQQLLRPDGACLERGRGAGVPGVPGPPQLRADSRLLCPPGPPRGPLRGGGRSRRAAGDGQHGRHGEGVAGGQRLLPPDPAGPHGRRAVPRARRAQPHGLHGQHRRHRPRLGHPERGAAAGVPGAPGLRHLSGAREPARVLGQRRQDGQVLAGRHRRARAHVHRAQAQRERPQVPRRHLVHGQRRRPRARLRRPVRGAAEGVPRPRARHQLHPGARPGAVHGLARRRAAPLGRARAPARPAAAPRRRPAQPLPPLQQQGGLRRRRAAEAGLGRRHPPAERARLPPGGRKATRRRGLPLVFAGV